MVEIYVIFAPKCYDRLCFLHPALCQMFRVHNLIKSHFCCGWWAAAAAAKSHQSCPTLWDPIDGSPPGSHPWDSPGKNTGVGCYFLLQCMKVKSELKSPICIWLSTTSWTVSPFYKWGNWGHEKLTGLELLNLKMEEPAFHPRSFWLQNLCSLPYF